MFFKLCLVLLRKLEVLTTFGRSDCNNNIYLSIWDLFSAKYGDSIPANAGQGHWLFHSFMDVTQVVDRSPIFLQNFFLAFTLLLNFQGFRVKIFLLVLSIVYK